MNYSDYRFALDITNTLQAQVSVPCTFGDSARRLYISLNEGRKSYSIGNGCRAVFAAKKPDGTTILNDCIIENNKTIVYEFSENTTNAEGVVDCEIRLYGTNGKLITTPQFILVVDKRVVRDEEIALSLSEKNTLDSIILSEANRVAAEAERVAAEAERIATYEDVKKLYGEHGIITLYRNGWGDNLQYVTIPDGEHNDFVIFYPATIEDNNALSLYNIYCNSMAVDSVAVFSCIDKPSEDIMLRYYINRGARDV